MDATAAAWALVIVTLFLDIATGATIWWDAHKRGQERKAAIAAAKQERLRVLNSVLQELKWNRNLKDGSPILHAWILLQSDRLTSSKASYEGFGQGPTECLDEAERAIFHYDTLATYVNQRTPDRLDTNADAGPGRDYACVLRMLYDKAQQAIDMAISRLDVEIQHLDGRLPIVNPNLLKAPLPPPVPQIGRP